MAKTKRVRTDKLSQRRSRRIEELAEHSVLFRVLHKHFPWVKTVSDATREVVLLVQQEDIDGAIPGDPLNCVGARCARRLGYDGAGIGRCYGFLLPKDSTAALRYAVGDHTKLMTGLFDLGAPVEPGEFLLSRVAPKQRLGAMRAATNRSAAHRRNTRRRAKLAYTKAQAVEAEALRTVVSKRGLRVWQTALAATT